jgi:hypothetical protein
MRGLMKLVVALATASACMTPFTRLVDLGMADWKSVAVAGTVVVPLVLAVASFPLVRRGPLKDWLIAALLTCAVVAAFVLVNVFLLLTFGAMLSRGMLPRADDLVQLAILMASEFVLGAGLVFLARRVVPRRCPQCRRFLLLRDNRLGSPRPEPWRPVPYLCLGCEARFLRVFRDWEPATMDEGASR